MPSLIWEKKLKWITNPRTRETLEWAKKFFFRTIQYREHKELFENSQTTKSPNIYFVNHLNSSMSNNMQWNSFRIIKSNKKREFFFSFRRVEVKSRIEKKKKKIEKSIIFFSFDFFRQLDCETFRFVYLFWFISSPVIC